MTRRAPWRRLVVIEANEVPRRVLVDHIRREPGSTLAHLVGIGALSDTESTERLERSLYPSQTWYSMNSGTPWEQHRVFWYGDPKPVEHPLYWQVAARAGRSVGLVNTLHSSPLAQRCTDGDYRFVIPDCFAGDPATHPARYERFQALNTALTAASGRSARLRPEPAHALVAASLPGLGVRPATIARLAAMAAGIAAGRINKERLRTAQAMVLADMFVHLGRRHDPDLAVLFTNHVASAMHRYWYASFPGDWDRDHYPASWVSRYRDEIPAAMRELDRMVEHAWRWCRATGRTLVLTTSMGQRGDPDLDTSVDGTAVVREPALFAQALGLCDRFTVGAAMVPQVHYHFDRPEDAARAVERIDAVQIDGGRVTAQRSSRVVTLSYRLGDVAAGSLVIDGRSVPIARAGVEWERVDDHRSGTHDPVGLLLVADPDLEAPSLPPRLDALDVAPLLLYELGVDVPVGMRGPVVLP